MTSLALLRRRARRAVLGRRRLLAAVFAAVAAAAALRSVTAPPPPTTTVLTAARDLPAGTVLNTGDLRPAAFTPESVPAGVLEAGALVGRTTASPLRAGEPLTDVRVVRGSLLDGYPGRVAAPVRIGDGAAVRLLRVGDRVDLLASAPGGSGATLLAADVPVIALPADGGTRDSSAVEGAAGALVVVAVTDGEARRVATAGTSSFVSLVLRR